MKLIKEFWPAIKFVIIFLSAYLACNIIYGLYIEYTYPSPDLFTWLTAAQSFKFLQWVGQPASILINAKGPTVFLNHLATPILDVYEGCNGVNVIIVFLSFIVAFAGSPKRKLVFIAAGIALLNLANVIRIVLLYFVATRYQTYFYFIHKYIFTISLYCIVVALWFVWINKLNGAQEAFEQAD